MSDLWRSLVDFIGNLAPFTYTSLVIGVMCLGFLKNEYLFKSSFLKKIVQYVGNVDIKKDSKTQK
jgi:hypothetical protein